MLGRSKPATSTLGRSNPRSAITSSRTSDVAVAVKAAIGGRPEWPSPRRQLVSERLAGSCRHDREDIAAVEDGRDHRLLSWTECLVPEVRAQLRAHFARRIAGGAHKTTTMASSSC